MVTAEGAVYNPVAEMVPTARLNDQVTAVLALPVTVAVNCCCWAALRVTVPGVTVTATWAVGFRVITTEVFLVLSAALVAVRVTFCCAVIEAGAVYNPFVDTVPTAGFSDQVTIVFEEPVIVAVNCCC